MGVNLRDIIPTEQISLESLSGKVIAIDAMNFLYQFLSSIRQKDGTPLMDSKGRVTSHLSGFFYRTVNFIETGIKPVYVWDGEPPEFKKREIEKRKEFREEAQEKWKEALEKGDFEEARKHAKAASFVSEEMLKDSKELLKAMGLPVIQAKTEGEAQCAKIVIDGNSFACASQDYDSLLFGALRLVRNLSAKEELEIIYLDEVLKNLGITREQLVLIGILVGTDYAPEGVKGIGPKRALDLVRKFRKVEEIEREVEWEHEVSIREIFDFFLNPEVEEKYEIKFEKPDPEKIKKILCDEHNFSEERVSKYIEKLERGKHTQRSLLGW